MTVTTLAVVRTLDDVDATCARLRALRGDDQVPVQSSRAEIHLPGVVAPPGLGEGAITWEFVSDQPAIAVAAVQATELQTSATLLPIASAYVESSAPLIKRTLLLRVRPDASTDARERFEADLAAMPEHISTIRSWRLSRVADNSRWTHAWEQEYASLDGLTGEYMTNPYHWTTVDAWFDAEMPEHIVEPELAHLFAARDEPWSRAELE